MMPLYCKKYDEKLFLFKVSFATTTLLWACLVMNILQDSPIVVSNMMNSSYFLTFYCNNYINFEHDTAPIAFSYICGDFELPNI